MTKLKPLGIIDIRPDLDDTDRAQIDVMLSHAPDQFDVEAAKNTGLGLQEGVASTTIPVRVGNLRGNIVALDELLEQINTDAESLRFQYKKSIETLMAESAQIDWS